MTTYTIHSASGTILGTFEADSPRDALDALAVTAGYEDHDDAGDASWTDSEAVFAGGTVDLLVTEE
jgi:hypothetical protein